MTEPAPISPEAAQPRKRQLSKVKFRSRGIYWMPSTREQKKVSRMKTQTMKTTPGQTYRSSHVDAQLSEDRLDKRGVDGLHGYLGRAPKVPTG